MKYRRVDILLVSFMFEVSTFSNFSTSLCNSEILLLSRLKILLAVN